MALSVLIQHNLLHKHEPTKELIKNIVVFMVVVLFVTSAVIPQPALAFEADLSHSPAQKLEASVKLVNGLESSIPVIGEADYANRLVNVVMSDAEISVTYRKQTETKLAYVSSAAANLPVPTRSNPLVLEGEASYYSRAGCLGCSSNMTMANGQPLNDEALTMAIGADRKHLVGYRAKVTNLATGLSVDVTITDTGGFYQEKYGQRVADLTVATKTAIGMYGGVGQVRVEVY